MDYREFLDMLLKKKILLPLSGISLAGPQHITLHLKKKWINRVSPIQSTISCTVSLITYTVLLSVSCKLMTKTMGLSFHLCYKSYVSQTEVEHFFLSLVTTHIFGKKKNQLVFLAPSRDSHLCSTFIFFLLLYYLP